MASARVSETIGACCGWNRDRLGGALDVLYPYVFAVVPPAYDHTAGMGVMESGDGLEMLVRPGFLPLCVDVFDAHPYRLSDVYLAT
jgi:hypothetical protein